VVTTPAPKVTTQLAIVVCVGILGIVGLIVGLAVFASWSEGAIIAMVTAFGAVILNTIITIRNQSKTNETLESQDVKLDTITAQTNGLSEIERQEIAERAAVAVVRQFRGGQ
jgi:hypothetical protein